MLSTLNITLLLLILSACSSASNYLAEERSARTDKVEKAAADVTIEEAVFERLEIQLANSEIPVGVSMQVKVLGVQADGLAIDVSSLVQWKSSDKAVAIVDDVGEAGGILNALAVGVCEISASHGTLSATKTLKVLDLQLESLVIKSEKNEAPAGGNGVRLHAEGRYSNGAAYDVTESASWSMNNDSRVHLSDLKGEKGLLLGYEKATVQVTAALLGKQALMPFAFLDPVVHAVYVNCSFSSEPFLACRNSSVSSCDPDMRPDIVGEKKQLEAYAYMTDCMTRVVTADAEFQSSDKAVADFTSTPGQVEFKSAGEAEARAVYQGKTSADHWPLRVKAVAFEALIFAGSAFPTGLEYCLGSSSTGAPSESGQASDLGYQFRVRKAYTDCRFVDATGDAEWLSASPDVADFSANTPGLLEVFKAGTTSVSARVSEGGVTHTALREDFAVTMQRCNGNQAGLLGRLYGFTRTPTNISDLAGANAQFLGQVSAPELNVSVASGAENFGVIFETTLIADTAGDYEFRVGSDDGNSLAIDGQEIISDPDQHAYRDTTSSPINLQAGNHTLKLKFFKGPGAYALRLLWKKPGSPGFSTVPSSQMFFAAGATCQSNYLGEFPIIN